MDDRWTLFSRLGSDTQFHGSSDVVSEKRLGGVYRLRNGILA